MIELPVIDPARDPAADAAAKGGESSKLWRSIAHRDSEASFVELARHEFWPGAADAPTGASRRQFLQLMGASMAMAGLAGCRKPVQAILPYSHKPEEIIPGISLQYATAMPFRGSVSALLVESHEGRPTKVEGNPQHPVSQGASGVFEQASILDLYDPDRSKVVRKNNIESSGADFATFCSDLQRGGAKRVAVLAAESSSPTLAAQRQLLEAAYPGLTWVTYSATGADNVAAGLRSAYGQAARPLYRFANAKVVVSLGSDFLAPTDRNFVSNTREFARGRSLDDDAAPLRLYVMESAYSVTGGMADHRLRVRASDIPGVAAAVASKLGVSGTTRAGSAWADHPFVDAVASDVRSAGSDAVVLAGEEQPPIVHALCASINDAIGATGRTVGLLDTTSVEANSDGAQLDQLLGDMNAGRVDVLLMLDVNPVYDAPAAPDFSSALQQVETTIHLGPFVDETAKLATWHIPASHYLEAWGDGRAFDGTLSIVQPLIAPLYNSKSAVETVNLLATGVGSTGYDLVRNTWGNYLDGDFESAWRRVLHDGFLPSSGFPVLTAVAGPIDPSDFASATSGIEVVVRLDPTLFDGSFANNAWLQETPDPTTKIVWDNVALMNRTTADQLGVEIRLDGGQYFVDRVDLSVDGRSVSLPAWVEPGVADDTIVVNLGYGREIESLRSERITNFFDTDDETDIYGHGAIATGVGVSVSAIRPNSFGNVIVGATVARVEDRYLIATTQDHGALPEDVAEVARRLPVRSATLAEYQANRDFVKDAEPKLEGLEEWEDYPPLWQENHPTGSEAFQSNPYYENQWGMVIDLNACTGCNACAVACQSENNIQVVGKDQVSRGREMSWIRLDRYFAMGDSDSIDDARMVQQPVPCMHCENAPCEAVCPVAATVHSPDGTNQMVYNRCIGTRYCANNCPYKVRRFNFYNWTKTLPESVQMQQNPNVTVRFRGVMEKCSYCIQRIRGANKRANLEDRPIREGEVLTACQQACPASAITFGDMNDPASELMKKKALDRRYEMLAPLDVKPRTSYLARIRNPNPGIETPG